jgi:hypothetical protein
MRSDGPAGQCTQILFSQDKAKLRDDPSNGLIKMQSKLSYIVTTTTITDEQQNGLHRNTRHHSMGQNEFCQQAILGPRNSYSNNTGLYIQKDQEVLKT